MQKLGRLERMNIRDMWAKEDEDFTPWLADNLHVLSEAIGIELELEAQEKSVGFLRADILARDIQTNAWVLIENQFGRTDHGHLGQIIAYAAGLQATTLVWIAEQFTDAHIAALEWMNSITDGSIRFFGVQIELWAIEELVAPKFTIVCKPNSWMKKGREYRKQKSEQPLGQQIAAIIAAEPDLSDRAIATRIGCSPTTVGNWRRNQDGQSVVNE